MWCVTTLAFPFSSFKAAVANCKGDYVNPTNEICANVLNAVDNVRFLHWPSYLRLLKSS